MTTEGERLRRADWTVVSVGQAVARRIVQRYHYAGDAGCIAVYRHGLVRRDNPLTVRGVAWWMPPAFFAARAAWDGDAHAVLSLSRLAIAPDVPSNAASFLIAGSVRLICEDGRYRCLLSYADTLHGHTGAIYRAANWEYMGEMNGENGTWTDATTGMLVSNKTYAGSRSDAEMRGLGYVFGGKWPKHKYRLLLPPARARRGLFPREVVSA